MQDVSKFLSGFKRFQHNYLGARRTYFDRLVKEGQHPTALVVACCDSRCDPALLTDCDPGDMFVVRNVANLVPPYAQAINFAATSSAIAFAVHNLEVEHVIVLGHAQCGGIRALIENRTAASDEERLIAKWLSIAEDARQKVEQSFGNAPSATLAEACERASILVSLENLMSYPWIRTRVESGKLVLLGWYFDLTKGELLQYDAGNGLFNSLVSNQGIGNTTADLWWRAPG